MAARRKPDRIFRFSTEERAQWALAEMRKVPGVERASILHDKGLMAGPRLVRPEHWQVKVHFTRPVSEPGQKPATRPLATSN